MGKFSIINIIQFLPIILLPLYGLIILSKDKIIMKSYDIKFWFITKLNEKFSYDYSDKWLEILDKIGDLYLINGNFNKAIACYVYVVKNTNYQTTNTFFKLKHISETISLMDLKTSESILKEGLSVLKESLLHSAIRKINYAKVPFESSYSEQEKFHIIDLGKATSARIWTQTSIDCYMRGCDCSGCYYREFFKYSPQECQMKVTVLELVRVIGRPNIEMLQSEDSYSNKIS